MYSSCCFIPGLSHRKGRYLGPLHLLFLLQFSLQTSGKNSIDNRSYMRWKILDTGRFLHFSSSHSKSGKSSFVIQSNAWHSNNSFTPEYRNSGNLCVHSPFFEKEHGAAQWIMRFTAFTLS